MRIKLLSLRMAIALTTTLSILAPTTVVASDDDKTIDMSNLTCEEFQDLGRMEKMMSMMWLSGWMAQQEGSYILTADRGVMSSRKDTLEHACEDSAGDLVMNKLMLQQDDN